MWFARTVTEPGRFSKILDLFVWLLILALLVAVALDTVVLTRASFAVVMVLAGVGIVGGLAYAFLHRGDLARTTRRMSSASRPTLRMTRASQRATAR